MYAHYASARAAHGSLGRCEEMRRGRSVTGRFRAAECGRPGPGRRGLLLWWGASQGVLLPGGHAPALGRPKGTRGGGGFVREQPTRAAPLRPLVKGLVKPLGQGPPVVQRERSVQVCGDAPPAPPRKETLQKTVNKTCRNQHPPSYESYLPYYQQPPPPPPPQDHQQQQQPLQGACIGTRRRCCGAA
jgi:hypothetical protein